MLTASSTLKQEMYISGIRLEGDVIERLATYIEEMGVQFAEKVNIVHRKSVFQILIYIMRLCPVDTGRLRGSFTTFMVANGFNGFSKYQEQPAIGGEDKDYKKKGFSILEFNKGQDAGEFVSAYLSTSIGTNVVYAGKVNNDNGYLTKALIWGDARYSKNMEAFLLATAMKEAVTDPIAQDDDGQGGL